MNVPASDKGGRPVDLAKLARNVMRLDGPRWLETLRKDADRGDSVAIQTIIGLALKASSKPPTPT